MVAGGMGLSVRASARLIACFEHPTHPACFKTWRVASSLDKEPESMTTSTHLVSRCAVPASRYSDLELSQLHAQAENALSVALWHMRQPNANLAGAARKAVQAMKAMHELRTHAADVLGTQSWGAKG